MLESRAHDQRCCESVRRFDKTLETNEGCEENYLLFTLGGDKLQSFVFALTVTMAVTAAVRKAC